ncbi:MAG: OmpA family protein [Acidobacteriia bacterium]|nr:OmpA family protein [Terriglobia bacterium]
MRERYNPWPAFVDLFSALFIAALAGFILIAAAFHPDDQSKSNGDEAQQREYVNGRITRVKQTADDVTSKIQDELNSTGGLQGKVGRCGEEETCVDLYIHFDPNKEEIKSGERKGLENTIEIIKNSISQLSEGKAEMLRDLEICIEGHTDSTQVSHSTDEHTRFAFNWNLSGRRATSVLHEFAAKGMSPRDYNIVAIGYADSKPACDESVDTTSTCRDQNRRTTLLLRPDHRRIEERLLGEHNKRLHQHKSP